MKTKRVACLVALWGAACQAPTQLELRVHTNLPCTDAAAWKGVAVYVGAPDGNLERKAPALVTPKCDASGTIGSLVITPSESKDAELGIRVVAGLERNPEECAASSYQGCVVARRAVRFSRHDTIVVDVELAADCRNVGCDATHTCIDGQCRDLRTVEEDASFVDASVRPGLNTVRCGDNSVVCPTTENPCCLSVDADAGTSRGECLAPSLCRSIVLQCDDEIDCAGLTDDRGRPGLCLLSYQSVPGYGFEHAGSVSGAQCVPYAAFLTQTHQLAGVGIELCEDGTRCSGDRMCVATRAPETAKNPMPSYHWCYLDEAGKTE